MNVRFLAHWLTTGAALGVSAWILPGVRVDSLAALAVAALVRCTAIAMADGPEGMRWT